MQEGEAGPHRDHLGSAKVRTQKSLEVIQCAEFILQREGEVALGDSWVYWVHGLESVGKRDPQWRNCLHQTVLLVNLWNIFSD